MYIIILAITFVFLMIRLLVAAYNYFSCPRLPFSAERTNARISVLIPARNEESNLPRVIESVLNQNISNIEILILDDHSSDATKVIASHYAKTNPQIRVLQGKALQDGWTGKNFACHQLALSATGNFLLFLDADVELHQGVIKSALHRMEEKGLSLLSLFCNQQTPTAGEKLTIPIMNYLLLTLLPLRLIERRTEPIFSAACGQFMLFKGSSYRLHLWHQQVRAHVTEDLAIMKLVKSSKQKGEGLLSGPLVSCRMYDGFRSAAQGFGKNFISPFNDSILLFLAFTLIVLLGPLFILAGAEPIEIVTLLSMITATRIMTNAQSGHPLWHIILHPLQMASFGYIAITCIFKRLTNAVEWKGRLISPILATSRHTADRAAVPAEQYAQKSHYFPVGNEK